MYKLGGKRKLGKKASHRKAMIDSQLRSLLGRSKVVTTTAKAKVLKANADSYIMGLSGGKTVDIVKKIMEYVPDEKLAKKLASYVSGSPSVKIVKIGFRSGDNAEVSKVYLDGLDLAEKKESRVSKKAQDDKKEDEAKEQEEASIESRSEMGAERAKNITKTLRDKVIGKERARTRSGL